MDEKKKYPFPTKEEAVATLKRDYCYSKIPPEKIPDLIEMSWQIGVDAAGSFREKWGDRPLDFMKVMKASGIEVVTEDKDYVSGQSRYFAEIQPKAMKVTLYRRSIQQWAKTNGYGYGDARNLILMHEYFHYLEYSELGYTSKKYQVHILNLFGLKLGKTGIAALSEIAADAFAGELFRVMEAGDEDAEVSSEKTRANSEKIGANSEKIGVSKGNISPAGVFSPEPKRTGTRMNRYAVFSFALSGLMILLNIISLLSGRTVISLSPISVPLEIDLRLYVLISSLIFGMIMYQSVREVEMKKVSCLTAVIFAVCHVMIYFSGL